ncbi:hypothetical protein AB0L00_43310 [Actinoallomurus sp. NPDC052308]
MELSLERWILLGEAIYLIARHVVSERSPLMTLSREPVPRRYNWTDFRSTLESDWAATLDSLGIEWEYEPTKFTLPSGAWYLPDFHLPKIGTWLEVKGTGVPGEEKARELAEALVCHCEATCKCAWPGGEIVLLGHASLRSPGKRFGVMHWYDALGGNALLGQCSHCGKRSWVRPRHSLTCRYCKVNDPGGRHFGNLLNTGDVDFRRSDRIEEFDF